MKQSATNTVRMKLDGAQTLMKDTKQKENRSEKTQKKMGKSLKHRKHVSEKVAHSIRTLNSN